MGPADAVGDGRRQRARRPWHVVPIDPKTGKPGKAVEVPMPTTCISRRTASSAIVVAEAMRRLEFRDPHTMELQGYINAPQWSGINHADFSVDGSYAIFTCEYNNSLVKIDIDRHGLVGTLQLGGRPHAAGHQDRAGRGGVLRRRHARRRRRGHQRRPVQGDRLHPDRRRDAWPLSQPRRQAKLYVTNRGTHNLAGVRDKARAASR